MKMLAKTILVLMLIGLVVCQDKCPKNCHHPKTKEECQACLDKGYSEVVAGRAHFTSTKLHHGAEIDWSGGRCAINLKGLDNKKDCETIGKGIFSLGGCRGYDDTEFVSGVLKKTKCLAKFNKA